MPSLKRAAQDEILPTHAPKIARTARRYHDLNSNPPQQEGIFSRWQRLFLEAVELGRDTVGYLWTGTMPVSSPPSLPTPPSSSASPDRQIAPPPKRRSRTSRPGPQTDAMPQRPSQQGFHRSLTPPPSPTRPVPSSSKLPPTAEKSSSSLDSNAAPSLTQSTTATSTSVSTTGRSAVLPLTATQDLSSRVEATFKQTNEYNPTERPRRRVHEPPLRHIHQEQHTRDVQARRKKMKEEMEKDLYQLQTAQQGYQADFQTFKGYLGYKERLEMLERRETLSPSRSLVNLHAAKEASSANNRRYSTGSEQYAPSENFLQRALERARETLSSPPPPKPFSPKADQLYSTRQRRNLDVSKSILQSRAKGLPTSLKPAEEAQVKAILSKQDVVSKCLREQVAAKDVKRLKPGDWLNDEIMNFWGAMILERSEEMKENSTAGATEGRDVNGAKINGSSDGDRSNGVKGKDEGKILNVHYFSTFFFTKLVDPGYEKSRLAKWTKRFDIFSKDIVLIPVNHANSHWTAAAINLRKKRIESYDSMNMNRSEVFKYLREYLNKESLDKKNKPFDFTGWEDYQALDAPQQFNGFDCGIFTCQFLEYLSRGKEIPFNFTQKDMPYIRKRMIWEIGNAKFMPHDEDP